MEAHSGLCHGCFRTLDEIARWGEMNDLEREEVLRKIQGRVRESSVAKTPQSQCADAGPAYHLHIGRQLKATTPKIMRTLGTRRQSAIGRIPTAESLLRAAAHVEAARSLAAVQTTGIAKGVYRFSTAEDASRHAEEALARVIVQNVRARQGR
jgi:predicted Fe-S protein YdhL (DUF1289 family)